MSKDLFSKQASLYAKYRPGYPKQLIEYVLSFVDPRETAWDCATGNGQAAILLSPYFKKIFATDISEKQISHAVPDPSIEYSLTNGEKTSFADNSFDLITVAQAYHWFHFESFYKEATRVGRPGAIVAVWGYGLLNTDDVGLSKWIRHFYSDIVGKYWDSERRYVDEEYKTVPFYFNELPSKRFQTDVEWNLADFIGYLNTWSSLQHFIKSNNYNPVDKLEEEIKSFWKKDQNKLFSFPIFMRIGKIVKAC
jgi:ubiquinone/menaquinone biosynthesis C-methylase UbiE